MLDRQMLDHVHRDHAADRSVFDPFETLRNAGQRYVQSALLQIGDRSLVDVETAGVDAGFFAGIEKLAPSAPDVEYRLLFFGALDVIVDIDVSAECVFESAVDEIGCPVVRLSGCQYRRGDVAQPGGYCFDFLVQRRDQCVVALHGHRDEIAKAGQLGCHGLIRISRVDLDGREVRFQILARFGDVAADIVEKIEKRDVEIFLTFGVRLDGTTKNQPQQAEKTFRPRRPRPISCVGLPHLAPRFGARRWGVDETIVHFCGACACSAGGSSNFSMPIGMTSTWICVDTSRCKRTSTSWVPRDLMGCPSSMRRLSTSRPLAVSASAISFAVTDPNSWPFSPTRFCTTTLMPLTDSAALAACSFSFCASSAHFLRSWAIDVKLPGVASRARFFGSR